MYFFLFYIVLFINIFLLFEIVLLHYYFHWDQIIFLCFPHCNLLCISCSVFVVVVVLNVCWFVFMSFGIIYVNLMYAVFICVFLLLYVVLQFTKKRFTLTIICLLLWFFFFHFHFSSFNLLKYLCKKLIDS